MENGILSIMKSNEQLADKIEAVCSIRLDGITDPDAERRYSIPGEIFASDFGGGQFVFLSDGSIGYMGQEDECGRIAENVTELFELTLNCADSFYNYSKKKFMNDSVLLKQEIAKNEPQAIEEFFDAFGDDYGDDYEAIRKEVADALGITISKDISEDVLPRYYKSATRDPLYFWENVEAGERSEDLLHY